MYVENCQGMKVDWLILQSIIHLALDPSLIDSRVEQVM